MLVRVVTACMLREPPARLEAGCTYDLSEAQLAQVSAHVEPILMVDGAADSVVAVAAADVIYRAPVED